MQNMAASYQKAIVDCLIDRTKKSIDVAKKSRPDLLIKKPPHINKSFKAQPVSAPSNINLLSNFRPFYATD